MNRLIRAAVLAGLGPLLAAGDLDWSHYVRIAGHGLSKENIQATIRESERTHVFGIEVDNDIPGRYESFLNPKEKLEAIRMAAQAAHRAGNKAFVYIAGLECITAHADKFQHSMFKDHPDWVQRNRDGQPAVFGGGAAFWITARDEDVWISPYAPEWRARYMDLVRQIAATGIDGIYVDIPYWMTHFDKWENTWASFDTYTVEAFRKRTGLDPLHDIKLGDPSDPGFRKWIGFRIASVTEFMREIDHNVKSANPKCLTIAEIFPGIESAVPRVGADVYQLYPVVDAIAHEYQGAADSIAASKTQFEWLDEMVGMFCFRAFGGAKPTWMLNYSWDGEKDVPIPDAMKTLFAAQLIAGANTWDAQGHVMSGSNDEAVPSQVFGWISQHEHIFYDAREPIDPIGVYFSPDARNYHPDELIPEFKAALNLLLLSHREFAIVTPRTLASFKGRYVIVPPASEMPSGKFDKLTFDATQLKDFEQTLERSYGRDAGIDSLLQTLAHLLPPSSSRINVNAPSTVVSQVARVNGRECVFLLNLKGITAKRKLDPDVESTVSIDYTHANGAPLKIQALPFLGELHELIGGISRDSSGRTLRVEVPAFERAIVVSFDSQR